jgi:hypothetical protein
MSAHDNRIVKRRKAKRPQRETDHLCGTASIVGKACSIYLAKRGLGFDFNPHRGARSEDA